MLCDSTHSMPTLHARLVVAHKSDVSIISSDWINNKSV